MAVHDHRNTHDKLPQPGKHLPDTGVAACHLSPLEITQTAHGPRLLGARVATNVRFAVAPRDLADEPGGRRQDGLGNRRGMICRVVARDHLISGAAAHRLLHEQ